MFCARTPITLSSDEPGETCSEGAIESTSASFKDACADVDMMTSRENNEEAASFVIPEDFLWGTVSDVDEEEFLKAAIARSLEDQKSSVEEIELQQLLEAFQNDNLRTEMWSIVILRKKLLQT